MISVNPLKPETNVRNI